MMTNAHNRKMQTLAQMRARTALDLRAGGLTWQEVGKKLGISRQRAHQIAKKYSPTLSNDSQGPTPPSSSSPV